MHLPSCRTSLALALALAFLAPVSAQDKKKPGDKKPAGKKDPKTA